MEKDIVVRNTKDTIVLIDIKKRTPVENVKRILTAPGPKIINVGL